MVALDSSQLPRRFTVLNRNSTIFSGPMSVSISTIRRQIIDFMSSMLRIVPARLDERREPSNSLPDPQKGSMNPRFQHADQNQKDEQEQRRAGRLCQRSVEHRQQAAKVDSRLDPVDQRRFFPFHTHTRRVRRAGVDVHRSFARHAAI